MATEDLKLNPYAAPATISESVSVGQSPIRTAWLCRLVLLQAAVIVISLIVEAYKHTTIVSSGPVFSLVGLAIAVVGIRNRDRGAVIFGTSAIVFALFIVFLINFNSWGPRQGDRPITILSFVYAAFALPVCARLFVTRVRSAESDEKRTIGFTHTRRNGPES